MGDINRKSKQGGILGKVSSALTGFLICVSLTGCGSGTTTDSATLDTTSSPQVEKEAEPAQPKSSDFIRSELTEYQIDEGGNFVIDGFLSIKHRVTNLSSQKIVALATTLTIRDASGKMVFFDNLNLDASIEPGKSKTLGLFGDTAFPLAKAFEPTGALLDVEDLSEETTLEFTIRKIALDDGSIIVFQEEIPENEVSTDE